MFCYLLSCGNGFKQLTVSAIGIHLGLLMNLVRGLFGVDLWLKVRPEMQSQRRGVGIRKTCIYDGLPHGILGRVTYQS
jgi:hypothetical protein